jgi:hypothetical protein
VVIDNGSGASQGGDYGGWGWAQTKRKKDVSD